MSVPLVLALTVVHRQAKLFQERSLNQDRAASTNGIAKYMSSSMSCKDGQHEACGGNLLLRVAVLEPFLAPIDLHSGDVVAQVHQVAQILPDLHVGSKKGSCSSVLNCNIRWDVLRDVSEVVHHSRSLHHVHRVVTVLVLALLVTLRWAISGLMSSCSTSQTKLSTSSKESLYSGFRTSLLRWR